MVLQSTKRQKVPTVLNIQQINSLLELLKEPGKTSVLVDILTGLCVSVLLTLKWSDVDSENLEIPVTRSNAGQHVLPCKTAASQKPVPLDPELAEALLMWRRWSPRIRGMMTGSSQVRQLRAGYRTVPVVLDFGDVREAGAERGTITGKVVGRLVYSPVCEHAARSRRPSCFEVPCPVGQIVSGCLQAGHTYC